MMTCTVPNLPFDWLVSETNRTLIGSLRGKRLQSSYCAKVRAGAKKKGGGGGGEKRKRLPANPRFWKTPLDISRFG